MALINCPECGRERISDKAEMCPSCSFPIKAYFEKEAKKQVQTVPLVEKKRVRVPQEQQQESPVKRNRKRSKSKGVKFGKVERIVDWVFAFIGGLLALVYFTNIKVDPDSVYPAVAFLIYTIGVLPINPILKLWISVFKERTKFLRFLILFVMFIIAFALIIKLAPETTSESSTDSIISADKIEDEDATGTVEPITSETISAEQINNEAPDTDLSKIKSMLGDFGYSNFCDAASEINLDKLAISHFEQIDDWASGKRYRFTYRATDFLLYMLDDGYVSGINCGLAHIYEDGYEPRNIDNFVVDANLLSQLITETEGLVKGQIYHPDTAKFHWLTTGGYSCCNGIYSISAEVDAKNSFGEKDTLAFNAQYEITDNQYKLIYLELGESVIQGQLIDPNAGRDTVESKRKFEKTSEDSFILTEGIAGEYGKTGVQDPSLYLYYVPAGTYSVRCLSKGMAFVNPPGDDEDTTVYKFDSIGDIQTIVVPEGNIVQLMINTSLEFTKK